MKLESPRVRATIDRLLADRETYQGRVREDLGRLWRHYLLPYRWSLLGALLITLIWAIHPYVMNLTARFLVDHVLRVNEEPDPALLPQQMRLFKVYVGILAVAWTVFVASHWTRSWMIVRVGKKLVYQLRKELHEKLQLLHVGFFERMETGRIMSRVLSDVKVIRQWATNQILNVVAQVLRLFIGLGLILFINWKLGLLALITLPLYGYAFARIRPRVRRANIAARRLNSTMYGLADERISGVAVVKAFSQERRERRSFAKLMHNYVRIGMQIIFYQQGLALLAGVLSATTIGLIIYFGMLQVKSGRMTLGDVVVFIYALPNLFAQVSSLTIVASAIQAVLVVIKRVFNILDEQEQVVPGKIKLDGMDGRIVFDHVTFTYPGQTTPALKEVSFQIPAGAKVAVMGPSGAGKSTIFQLLERFYDPQEGSVRVGGVNLVDADPASIHTHIRMVQQEPVIFSGTIAENISYGRLDATPTQIMNAAKQAELHDFIMSMPVKYETMVGQNGVSLSGGQKQRLALATALLTEPEVLLLDDTTSALDAETEARIRLTLDHALQGRTSLIITQRIATARNADMILVLEDGRITQIGTHEELIKQEGFYRRIWQQQEGKE